MQHDAKTTVRLRRRLQRAVAALSGVTLALGIGLVLLVLRAPAGGVSALLDDEELRAEALAELVSTGAGVFDSHQDPDVGRILQPNLERREYAGVPVSSNSFGMREDEYTVKKPDGTTRIVLLGDSYVFGYGVQADERLGVLLCAALETRAPDLAPVEVLHFGISSWNVLAECAYLRRQLSLIEPDLVVQITVTNDLSDTKGLRGFGAVAGYSSQVRHRADALLKTSTSRQLWTPPLYTHLIRALDHEGRARYARVATEIGRLARAVDASGGKYLHVASWSHLNAVLYPYLAPELRDEQQCYLSPAFSESRAYVIGGGDEHWNPDGHRVVATLLYGLIRRRDLLPGVDLQPWDEAERALREIDEPGLAAARADGIREGLENQSRKEVRDEIDFGALTGPAAMQIYGGIDRDGYVGPYASLVLANRGAAELVLHGSRLGRPELAGGEVSVWLETERLGTLALAGEDEFDKRWPLPADLREREWLNLRFEATDFVYRRISRGDCVSFVLHRVALR